MNFVRNKTGFIARGLLALAFVASGAAAQAANDLPGKGVTVQPLKSSLAEEAFQTLLVMRGLEKLGYKVEPMKDLEPATEHLAIANGDATFMAHHWSLLHADSTRTAAATPSSGARACIPKARCRAT